MVSMTLIWIKIFFFCFTWRTWRHITTTVWKRWLPSDKWQICSSYAMAQKKYQKKKCIIRKDFCMTLPCVDKFCGDNRSSLEGGQRMCLFPERRGLSSAAQCPFHLTLSLQGSQSVRPHFLWTKSRHTKARTQCGCPTPHLCSTSVSCGPCAMLCSVCCEDFHLGPIKFKVNMHYYVCQQISRQLPATWWLQLLQLQQMTLC